MKHFSKYVFELIVIWFALFVISIVAGIFIPEIRTISVETKGSFILMVIIIGIVIQLARFIRTKDTHILAKLRGSLNEAAMLPEHPLAALTDRSESRSEKNKASLYSLLAFLCFIPTLGILYQWGALILGLIMYPNAKGNGLLLLIWPLYLFQIGILFCSLYVSRFFYRKNLACLKKAAESNTVVPKV